MRYIKILLLFIVIYINPFKTYAQYDGKFFKYGDAPYSIEINGKKMTVYTYIYPLNNTEPEQYELLSEPRIVFDGYYDVDSLNNLFIYFKRQQIRLKFCEDSIIWIDTFDKEILSNTVFYCIYRVMNKKSYAGNWKDGKRVGDWLFFEDNKLILRVKYDKGLPIDSTFVNTQKITDEDIEF